MEEVRRSDMVVALRQDQEAHLKLLCEQMGRSVDDFVREAVLTFMEDYEDGRDAEAVLALNGPTYTSEEVRKRLGLDDSIHGGGSEAA
jgi:predicted DNA-binding protein